MKFVQVFVAATAAIKIKSSKPKAQKLMKTTQEKYDHLASIEPKLVQGKTYTREQARALIAKHPKLLKTKATQGEVASFSFWTMDGTDVECGFSMYGEMSFGLDCEDYSYDPYGYSDSYGYDDYYYSDSYGSDSWYSDSYDYSDSESYWYDSCSSYYPSDSYDYYDSESYDYYGDDMTNIVCDNDTFADSAGDGCSWYNTNVDSCNSYMNSAGLVAYDCCSVCWGA